jgi:tetratricopeptide (TPR) repeat protein
LSSIYRLITLLSISLLASGCVTHSDHHAGTKEAFASIELTDTPFYPQSRYQCGPASLATVLSRTGLDIDPDQLAGEVYIPDRKGTLQLEMIAAVRRYGRIPYDPGADFKSIQVQLDHGLPVLVFLNLGIKALPVWHYAVVIGYEPESDAVILRSGPDYRLLMPRKKFLSAWNKSDNWSLVVLPPGVLPAAIDVDRYVRSIIALESVGQWHAAELSYRAVLKQWPTNTLASFGLANALRSLDRLDEAVAQYNEVIKQDPRHKPARNNLADTLLSLDRCAEAFAVLEKVVIEDGSDTIIDRAMRDTRSEIQETCTQR